MDSDGCAGTDEEGEEEAIQAEEIHREKQQRST